jgi:hypothetical protein
MLKLCLEVDSSVLCALPDVDTAWQSVQQISFLAHFSMAS